MKKDTVVCAIDVNDFDQSTVDTAAAFAEHFETQLDILHVTLFPDPMNSAWPAYLGSPNQLIKDNRLLKAICAQIKSTEVHFHHLSGLPVEKILSFVDGCSPKILVMGTHGRTGLAKLFRGSVASQVMRRAKCPVLLLRQKESSEKMLQSDTQQAIPRH